MLWIRIFEVCILIHHLLNFCGLQVRLYFFLYDKDVQQVTGGNKLNRSNQYVFSGTFCRKGKNCSWFVASLCTFWRAPIYCAVQYTLFKQYTILPYSSSLLSLRLIFTKMHLFNVFIIISSTKLVFSENLTKFPLHNTTNNV